MRLPALATAHSHAFQRAMRGAAQRRGDEARADFWSWRGAMYAVAERLDPDAVFEISRVAYRELAAQGVRTVGEFHYVHHQPGGAPYEERTVLAQRVIEAARAEGLRVALLRVVYARAGAGRALEAPQRRFVDASLDDALRDVDDLRARYAGARDVVVGIAPHSVRAVPPDWLGPIAAFARERDLVVHAHVAEQPREVEECVAETGRRPVELLAERGVLSPRFVAVHATHLAPHEARLLGEAGAGVCLCPTTERDLGDGLPDASALVAAGVRLSVGVDSHVRTDPLEDLREVELHERLRTLRRVVLGAPDRTLAEWLWEVGSREGERACGFAEPAAPVEVDRAHPSLALVPDERLLDALVFGGASNCLR